MYVCLQSLNKPPKIVNGTSGELPGIVLDRLFTDAAPGRHNVLVESAAFVIETVMMGTEAESRLDEHNVTALFYSAKMTR